MMTPLWVKIFFSLVTAFLAVSLVLSVKRRRWLTPWGRVTPDQKPFVFWMGMTVMGVVFLLFFVLALGSVLSS